MGIFGLSKTVMQDAKLYPSTGSVARTVNAGLYSQAIANRYRHQRRGKAADMRPPEDLINMPHDTLDGTHLYGGIYSSHFGHLVAEFVHRMWVLDQYRDDHPPVVLAGQLDKPYQSPVLTEIFRYFGADAFSVITRPATVERLVVPQQAKELYRREHRQYRPFLARAAERAGVLSQADTPRRLAILRDHLRWRRLTGEAELARFLEWQGYMIFRPEEHGLLDQLKMIANADEIVMADGSPAHLYDLLPYVGGRVFYYGRNRFHRISQTSVLPKVDSLTEFVEIARVIEPWTGNSRSPNLALQHCSLASLTTAMKDAGFVRDTLDDLSADVIARDIQDFMVTGTEERDEGLNKSDIILAEMARAHLRTARLMHHRKATTGWAGVKNRLRHLFTLQS